MKIDIDWSNAVDVKNFAKKVKKQLDKIIPEVTGEMANDIKKQYEDAIDDFYDYKTKMYVRVGQSKPGTGTGINLYKAIDVKPTKQGNTYGVWHDFDYTQLDSHNPSKISFKGKITEEQTEDSDEEILEMVLMGERYNVGSWSHDYDSIDFQLSGNMQEVNKQIHEQFSDVASEKIMEKFDINDL